MEAVRRTAMRTVCTWGSGSKKHAERWRLAAKGPKHRRILSGISRLIAADLFNRGKEGGKSEFRKEQHRPQTNRQPAAPIVALQDRRASRQPPRGASSENLVASDPLCTSQRYLVTCWTRRSVAARFYRQAPRPRSFLPQRTGQRAYYAVASLRPQLGPSASPAKQCPTADRRVEIASLPQTFPAFSLGRVQTASQKLADIFAQHRAMRGCQALVQM